MSTTFDDSLADEIDITPPDGVVTYGNLGLVDTVRLEERTPPVWGHGGTWNDQINMSEALLTTPGVIVSEVLSWQDTAAPAFIYGLGLADGPSLTDLLNTAYPLALSDEADISSALTVTVALVAADGISLLEGVTPVALYNLALAQAFQLSSSFANFFGGELVDGVTTTEAFTGIYTALPTITDTINLSEAIGTQLVFRLIAEDSFTLADADILNAIYSGDHLLDGVELSAAYFSPAGGITTWAVNTRTGSVTEYGNFAFNSFARLGNTYIGASATGLYHLVGDTDDGASIIAQLKSGLASFANTRLSSFKAAYLGVRGDGDFVFKVVTGEGVTYNYAVTARSMRSTKIHVGKGLRARYFGFELISTGSDFDLDMVEFVPLVEQRRV